MFEAFMKQLQDDGSGQFSVVRIAAETEEGLKVKRDIYLGDSFQDATEAEYRSQFAARTAPIESEADKALGEEKAVEAPEDATSEPQAPEAQGTPEAAPEASPEAPAPSEEAAPVPEPES
mgnify:CR=1 FL=1